MINNEDDTSKLEKNANVNNATMPVTKANSSSTDPKVVNSKITQYFTPAKETPEWQVITDSSYQRSKRKREDGDSPTNISNRFNQLEDHNDEEKDSNQTDSTDPSKNVKEYKPPPVFLKNVIDYPKMIDRIIKGIGKEEFYRKAMSNSSVKVSALNPDTYRKLIKFLNDNDAAYYTYQMKEEKPYRVVIRNLHYSISEADINEALKDKGYEVRRVTNIRNWRTKEPLSLFFVDIEPNKKAKEIPVANKS